MANTGLRGRRLPFAVTVKCTMGACQNRRKAERRALIEDLARRLGITPDKVMRQFLAEVRRRTK